MHGLVKRELEIVKLLHEENIDILFLTETDTIELEKEEDFKIKGYSTIFPKRNSIKDKIRIICIIKESICVCTKIRTDLMDTGFASIWIEVNKSQNRILFAGFYREWSYKGSKTETSQLESLNIFTNQIEKATNQSDKCVVIGDANLCSQKWKESNYPHKLIANCLMDTLEQCGLTQKDVGETYLANHTQANGKVASSAIDHIYCSKAMENSV